MADSNNNPQNNGDSSGGGLIAALILAGIAAVGAIGKGIRDHIKGKKLRKKFKQDKEG